MKKSVQNFARSFCCTGKLIAFFNLSDYLRFAHHETIQTRRDCQQVPDCIFVFVCVKELTEFFRLNVMKFREKLSELIRIGPLMVFAGTINLNPVTGRYKYELGLGESFLKLAKCLVRLGCNKGQFLSNLFDSNPDSASNDLLRSATVI